MVPEPAPEPVPEPNAVERLKATSDYLRDPLVAEFAAGGTHITDDGYNILKFHGSYQQDDRDVRNDRRKSGVEYDFGFMIRLRVAARRHPPGAVAGARRSRHAVRPVVDPAHDPPERPAPLHPQERLSGPSSGRSTTPWRPRSARAATSTAT